MYRVINRQENKIAFDFGAVDGRQNLSNQLSQGLLKRVFESPNGAEYVFFENSAAQVSVNKVATKTADANEK